MPKPPPPGSRSHPAMFRDQARLGYQKKDLEEAKAAIGPMGPMDRWTDGEFPPCSDPWDPWDPNLYTIYTIQKSRQAFMDR